MFGWGRRLSFAVAGGLSTVSRASPIDRLANRSCACARCASINDRVIRSDWASIVLRPPGTMPAMTASGDETWVAVPRAGSDTRTRAGSAEWLRSVSCDATARAAGWDGRPARNEPMLPSVTSSTKAASPRCQETQRSTIESAADKTCAESNLVVRNSAIDCRNDGDVMQGIDDVDDVFRTKCHRWSTKSHQMRAVYRPNPARFARRAPRDLVESLQSKGPWAKPALQEPGQHHDPGIRSIPRPHRASWSRLLGKLFRWGAVPAAFRSVACLDVVGEAVWADTDWWQIMAIYLDYDQEGLDAQYNCRAMVSDAEDHIARWVNDSATARNTLRCDLDVAYGSAAAEKARYLSGKRRIAGHGVYPRRILAVDGQGRS